MALANARSWAPRMLRALGSAQTSRAVSLFLAAAPVVVVAAGGLARRWMDDDGFINLRIVRNWLAGHGPVYNLGERVEAATSPLWLGLVALLGATGARLEHAVVLAGIALTTAGLALAERGAWRLGRDEGPSGGALLLPVGAAIVAVLPPVWDYASGGLETGLGLAWLGCSYCALARRARPGPGGSMAGSVRVRLATGALVGVGPLVRPEFAIHAAALLAPYVWAAGAEAGPRRRSRIGVAAWIVLGAAAVPVAQLVFRMGYYGAVVPNTALAKEAFLANWSQGRCYFDNFAGTYRLGWPLAAAAPFWLARLRAHVAARRGFALALTAALPVSAAVHGLYVVRMGGDYMHARLLVPTVFALLLPVMAVPASSPRVASARWLLGVGEVALGAWLPVCAAKLRVSVDNVCDVGDERGWYARMAHVNHPVTLDAYRNHPFYDGALSSLRRVYARCPALSEAAAEARAGECRRVFLDEDGTRIAPIPDSAPVADGVDPRVTAVVPARAIGMLGYLYPPDVHVVDVHGLAEPIAARFELETRGRPGHEKQLTAAWLLARFAAPAPDEDASVTAARRALRCGALRSFVDAITAPMSARRFFLNLAQAWSNSRLRVPTDPFEAEVRFCGAPPMIVRSSGGEGGGPYRWRCPPGATLSGVRGAFKPADRAVSFVQALCSGDVARGAALVGPRWGEASSPATFELGCPSDATLIGLHGTSDNLVRSVAPLCVRRGQPLQVPAAGAGGRRFTLECPDGREPVGIAGRAGDLVDAVGLLCPPRDGAGSP